MSVTSATTIRAMDFVLRLTSALLALSEVVGQLWYGDMTWDERIVGWSLISVLIVLAVSGPRSNDAKLEWRRIAGWIGAISIVAEAYTYDVASIPLSEMPWIRWMLLGTCFVIAILWHRVTAPSVVREIKV